MKRRFVLPPLVILFVLGSLQFHSHAQQDSLLQPVLRKPSAPKANPRENFFVGAERELTIRQQASLEEIQARNERAIMTLPGVMSIGIGLDPDSRQMIYVITVDKDKPLPRLPSRIEGVPVRVEEATEMAPIHGGNCQPCHSDLHDYPVECGNSFSEGYSPLVGDQFICKACSMGFKAYKQDNGDAEWLTNAHCQRGTNNCDGQKALESPNFHPAMLDRSVLGLCLTIPVDSKNVGFTRGIILEDQNGRNLDAAIIGSGDDAVSRSVRDIGVPDTNPGTVVIGDVVQKSGRTTGHTKGRVTSVNLTRSLEYSCRGFLTFSGVIETTIDIATPNDGCTNAPCFMAQGGDSGSGVFSNDSPAQVVGLLFGGSQDGGTRGLFFPIQRVLNAFNLTLDPHTTGSCSNANDHEPPATGTPAFITQGTDPGQCSAVVTYSALAVDNCTTKPIITCEPASGQNFLRGVTTVSCVATDLAGNTNSPTFTVTIEDDEAPNITTCPSSEIVQGTDSNQCSAVVSFEVAAQDNCDFVTPACTPASGSTFAKGITTVSCTATDSAGNASSACTFTVKVNDTQNPSVSQANITKNTDANECSAGVTFTPTVNDNCSGVGSPSCTPASGSEFPKGTTTVSCSVSDSTGNSGSASFTVTVNDTQAPTISCPSNIVTGNDANSCSAMVSFNPTVNDNCPNVGAPACSPASGSIFPKGTTTVTCSVTDASNNSSTQCSFTVKVNDTQKPAITCPVSFSVPAAPGVCSAVATFAAPTVGDNCPGVGSATCSPASSSTFPKGVTSISCSVQDAAGNQSSCSFAVTVLDTQAPSIACPANMFVATINPGDPSVAVSFGALAADNCPGVSVLCVPASGSQFPRGTTTVTCTATDSSNNSTSCSFTVRAFDYVVVDTAKGLILRFLSTTGDYDFLDCAKGTSLSGRGTLSIVGCKVELRDLGGDPKRPDRNVFVQANGCTKVGSGNILIGVTAYMLSDPNMSNNVAKCP